MDQDGSFVIWIIVLAIPVGLLLISLWSRGRPPGDDLLKRRERDPDQP